MTVNTACDAVLSPMKQTRLAGGFRTVSNAELASVIAAVEIVVGQFEDRIAALELPGRPVDAEPADPVVPTQTANEPEPSSEGAPVEAAVDATAGAEHNWPEIDP